jgi:hypothetical protein
VVNLCLQRYSGPYKEEILILICLVEIVTLYLFYFCLCSFNLINRAEVLDVMATEFHGITKCRSGELFLRLPLTENLTEDTGAGKLILTR